MSSWPMAPRARRVTRAGSDQEQQREPDFGDQQDFAEPSALGGASGPRTVQQLGRRHAGAAPGRQDSREQGHDHTEQRRHETCTHVGVHDFEHFERRRPIGDDERHQRNREREPEPGAEEADDSGVDETELDLVGARCSERGADRPFVSLRQHSAQQQVRDVGAGDQQQDADRAQQDVQGPDVPGADLIAAGVDRVWYSRSGLILRLEPWVEGLELGPRRRERGAIPEPSDEKAVLVPGRTGGRGSRNWVTPPRHDPGR
jgi:hypothetical protein